jgi:type I restriction enzyme S subunit
MSDEWKKVRLGEVLAIKHGYAFRSEHFSSDLTGRPIVVNIGNFSYTGGFRFATTQTREFRGDYPKEFELSAGDLLIVMTCQTAGGEILGVPAIVEDDGRVYLHNQRIGKVLVNKQRLDRRFGYYLFLSPAVNWQLASTATGTKILHTSPERIASVSVMLPPLKEQQAIAEVLGALDDKIEMNRTLVLTADRLLQAIFDRSTEQRGETHTADQVLEPILGGTPARDRSDYWAGPVPWATAKDVASSFASVRLPPGGEWSKLTSQLSRLDERVQMAITESGVLRQLRDALLPPLLSGRLRVQDAGELVGEAV